MMKTRNYLMFLMANLGIVVVANNGHQENCGKYCDVFRIMTSVKSENEMVKSYTICNFYISNLQLPD